MGWRVLGSIATSQIGDFDVACFGATSYVVAYREYIHTNRISFQYGDLSAAGLLTYGTSVIDITMGAQPHVHVGSYGSGAHVFIATHVGPSGNIVCWHPPQPDSTASVTSTVATGYYLGVIGAGGDGSGRSNFAISGTKKYKQCHGK